MKNSNKTAPADHTLASQLESAITEPKETTTETPETDSVRALLTVVDVDLAKKDDSLDSFLAEISKAQAANIRKETKAFLSDIKAAAGKVTSAIVHLYNVHTLLASEELFAKYSKALVAEGHVTAGTLYTLTQKIKVFETLKLPEIGRSAIMAYSGGDSIIVRRALTPVEVKQWKQEHPATKAPKGVYEPSPYFVQACEVVDAPAKWSADTADTWAGRCIRLASKLRGKARSGATANQGDAGKIVRFESAVDKLEVYIKGEMGENGIKGMIVLTDKTADVEMLTDCAETIMGAICSRLTLASLDSLYETIDALFVSRKETLEKADKKTSKAA
jgi:hypothetical protein